MKQLTKILAVSVLFVSSLLAQTPIYTLYNGSINLSSVGRDYHYDSNNNLVYDDTYTLDPSEATNKVGNIPNRVYRMYSGFQSSSNSISTNVAGHDKAEATEFTITYSGPASNQTVNLKIGATSYSSNAEAWSGVLTYPISKAVSGSNTISLNASELTTVTNWIKAGLTIYFGAVINNEQNDASYFYISNVVVRYKKRFEVVVSIDRDYDENSVVSLNGQPIVGTGGTLKFDELSTVNIAASIQVNYNSQPYVFSSMSLSGQTITSTSYSFAISADRTLSLTYVAARSITLDNRANYSANPSDRIEGSTITIKNSGSNYSTATAGQTKYLPQNANMSFTTNHGNYGEDLNFKGQGYKIKHRDWNESLAEFKLEKFQTITDNSSFTAWYHELQPATIKLSFDGILQNNIPMQFKDPWRVVNGAQPGNWDTYNSGANLGIGNDGSTIVGVFKSVDYIDDTKAHYRVKTDAVKTVSGTDYNFSYWGGTNIQAYTPTLTESPVKFNASGAVVTANYKGNLRTGRPDLSDAKNQRRFASNNAGTQHVMLYESMGDVWITSSNGSLWFQEERLNTIPGAAKNPTLSNLHTFEGTVYGIASWIETNSSGTPEMHLQTFRLPNGGPYQHPVWYGWTTQTSDRSSDNHRTLQQMDMSLTPRTEARSVLQLVDEGNGFVSILFATETAGTGISSGIILIDIGSDMDLSTYTSIPGGPFYGAISTNPSDICPVIIYYPTYYSYPERTNIYFLGAGYGGGLRVVQSEFDGTNKIILPTGYQEYTYTSLQGVVNPLSASFGLIADGLAAGNNRVSVYYAKPTYNGNNPPSVSTYYTNMTQPTLQAERVSSFGNPLVNISMKNNLSNVWYAANGSQTLTTVGSNIAGVFSRGLSPSGDKTVMLVRNNVSPAKIEKSSSNGQALSKSSSSIAQTNTRIIFMSGNAGKEKLEAILDFSGASITILDTMQTGNQVSVEVEQIANSIVAQKDSLRMPVGVELKRNGKTIRSYSPTAWNNISGSEIEGMLPGDILQFTLKENKKDLWWYKEVSVVERNLPKEEVVGGNGLIPTKQDIGVFPNPFNPTTTFRVSLPQATNVRLAVYNMLGQKVATIIDGMVQAGYNDFHFDGSSLSSGIYLYRMEIAKEGEREIKSGKIMLMK